MEPQARKQRTRNRMGRAQHPRRVAKETVLQGHAVERILEADHQHFDGNPVTGIRNGVLYGLVVWSLLAFGFVYIR